MSRTPFFGGLLARVVLAGCFLLAPLAVVSLILWTSARATLLDCVPTWWDEILYWNEIACFSRAGFDGGYCVVDEHPAACRACHFGPHGPGFPAIYGSLAQVFGWRLASGACFNAVFLLVAAGVWLWCCRPDASRLAIGALLMASFWPCLLWMPTLMQEPLHCAIALVLAGLAHRGMFGNTRGPIGSWIFFVAVVAASLIRLTWIVLLIPWACVAFSGVRWPARVAAWGAAVSAMAAALLFSEQMCAPYPNFLSWAVAVGKESPGMAFCSVLFHGEHALATWFTWLTPLETLQHFEVAGLAALGVGICCARRPDWRPYLFVALQLLLVAGGMILFYDVFEWRDYRVVAPHLLLSLLLLLSGPAPRLVAGTMILHLALAGPFLTHFLEIHESRVTCNRRLITESERELAALMAYRPAPDAWENTLLVRVEHTDQSLLGLPKGIGVTVWLPPGEHSGGPDLPLKSKYVLLDEPAARSLQRRCHLHKLADLPSGQIYLNLDSFP
jgi:hypothetical protein